MKQYFWEMPDKLEYRIKRIWEALEGQVHIKIIENLYHAKIRTLPIQADYYPINEGQRLAYRQTLSELINIEKTMTFGENYEIY